MTRLGLVILAALALAGCPAAHSDFPSQSCKTDSDCYLGEHCLNNSICVAVGGDLATAPKKIDMSGPDLGMP